MGTYRGFKTEVFGGGFKEIQAIIKLILADAELASSLNKWDGNIKNWTPDDKLAALSMNCKNSCILLTTVIEAREMTQTAYYKGMAFDALSGSHRRGPVVYLMKATYKAKLRGEL